MTKVSTKEEALQLYINFVKADLELYNSTCKEGLEIRMEDFVSELCFEQKINNRFTPSKNWWDGMVKEDDNLLLDSKKENY